MSKLKVGDEYSMAFPFTKDVYSTTSGSALFAARDAFFTWSAGCELYEEIGDNGYVGQRDFTANGEGRVVYSILAITELTGRFQDRIIFKRWLVDPDGVRYNNGEVRMLTIKAFEKDINSHSPFRADYEVEIKEHHR